MTSEAHADEFFARISKFIKRGGRFIATFPCCERIANRMRNMSILTGDSMELSFGNEMYRVSFSPDDVCKILPSLEEGIRSKSSDEVESVLNDLDTDEVLRTVSNTWGVQYKFWLTETIDNQEEYIVPLSALEKCLLKFGMQLEFEGNFADVIERSSKSESSILSDFRKKNSEGSLSEAEEDVFRFYRAVVFKKE